MSVVLYALGAGLICWSGYMLLAGDSFAALDIAASLAGWGVFAVGLGAVAAGLGRLARALEASARPTRGKAPRGGPLGWLPSLGGEGDVVAAKPKGGRRAAAEPALAPSRSVAPAVEAAPVEPQPRIEPSPRAERRIAFQPAPFPKTRVRPAPPVEPEPAAPEPEPAVPAAVEPEPVVEAPVAVPAEPAPAAAQAPAVRPQADEADAALTKREIKLKRREEKLKQESESFERPEIVAPRLGGGRPIFSGGEGDRRAVDRPGPVSPPLERAVRPPAPLRRPEPEAEPAAEPVAVAAAETPAAPPPAPEAARPEPKVPEWLARARARREAKAVDQPGGAPAFAEPAGEEPVAPGEVVSEAEATMVAAFEAEVQQGDVAATDPVETVEPEPQAPSPVAAEPQPEPEAVEAPEPEPAASAGPALVREGEHRGVTYRFYDDGSVEAHSPHGVRRFATVDDLRATVIAARGADYAEPEPEAPASPDKPQSDAAEEPPSPGGQPDDPLEAALSELEGAAGTEQAAARRA